MKKDEKLYKIKNLDVGKLSRSDIKIYKKFIVGLNWLSSNTKITVLKDEPPFVRKIVKNIYKQFEKF